MSIIGITIHMIAKYLEAHEYGILASIIAQHWITSKVEWSTIVFSLTLTLGFVKLSSLLMANILQMA